MLNQPLLVRHLILTALLLLTACVRAEIPSDPSVAKLQAKAEAGDAKAQGDLGLLYLTGFGVPRNETLAQDWCRKAAAQAVGAAENCLGLIYEEGRGVPPDRLQALEWYHRAAADRDRTAARNLAALDAVRRVGAEEAVSAEEQLLQTLKTQRIAIEQNDRRPDTASALSNPCANCIVEDRSGHGAVLCALELSIDVKAGLDRCYPEHVQLRSDLAQEIEAINDFVVVNSRIAVTKKTLEREERQKAEQYNPKHCPVGESLLISLAAMEMSSRQAVADDLVDLLSVPRVPVMNPCL